ncbi:unnamed protein product [Linum tenue]|uniref:SGNH hydrolase-type esterase domain-containing protein n=1 Tax=Linum tenue TaxID=586396 RepID=A0AAV0KVV8_9ROSI|nr:unnamed protein product [Linum tenue]
MVGTARPVFVLFGSSIVQFSYGVGGWGAMLSDYYSRKDAATHPALVIVYFGGNDSCSQDRSIAHVPLPEYYENMKKIAAHLKCGFLVARAFLRRFASSFLLLPQSMRR